VHRWQIGFMGCQAALQGLQAADAICRADPQAVVLLVCAELCTLHFQRQPNAENLVANSLFADGAAAVILSSAVDKTAAPLCGLECFSSYLAPATRELISWRIGDKGFQMGLNLEVPQALGALLPDFIEALLPNGAGARINAWAVHPGGRAILDTVQRVLGLEEAHLSASRAVLRQYGNMSSPTVLFVLDRLLAEQPQADGVALSFGPGLSLEGMRWRTRTTYG
jgi:predicted naringenin-chalcone synthase